MGVRLGRWAGILHQRVLFELLSQRQQSRANTCPKETEVTHFHKSSREHMLQKALNELLRRERTQFELSRVGRAVLKSNPGSFHTARINPFDQATVANSNTVNIGRQILERRLPIAHGLAMHDPLAMPDFCWYLGEEGRWAQMMLEPGAEQAGQSDAEWIAELMQYGLLKPSFVPPEGQRELRELTRYRSSFVRERATLINRVHKLLESANLKLASVATDVMGVSGRAMLAAIVAGNTDPQAMADLAKGRMREKRLQLAKALEGRVKPHHRFVLTELLCQIDSRNEVWVDRGR